MTNIRGYSRTVGHESAVVPLPTLGKLEKPENQKITTLCVKVGIIQIRDTILQIAKNFF